MRHQIMMKIGNLDDLKEVLSGLEREIDEKDERIVELEDVLFDLYNAWDGYEPEANNLEDRVDELLSVRAHRSNSGRTSK